jgi:hypothetical protein
MVSTAAVGIAECPPLSGHASAVVMRRFGARERAFLSAELGRTCRVPENAARIAAKNLGVAAARKSSRISWHGAAREGVALVRAPSVMRVPDREDCGTHAASLL